MAEKTDHYTAIKLKGDVAGRSGAGLVDGVGGMDVKDGMDGMDGMDGETMKTTTTMKKTITTAGRISACLS